MRTNLNFGFLTVFLVWLAACGACMTPPESFNLKVVNSTGKNLLGIAYKQEDIRLYQVHGMDTQKVDFKLFYANDSAIYLSSTRVGWLASGSTKAYKTFYLQLGNSAPDVLYVDVRRKSFGSCTHFEYRKVLFNGKTPEKEKRTETYFLKK